MCSEGCRSPPHTINCPGDNGLAPPELFQGLSSHSNGSSAVPGERFLQLVKLDSAMYGLLDHLQAAAPRDGTVSRVEGQKMYQVLFRRRWLLVLPWEP